jgi:SAM-dependent methyltransferase
VEKGLVTWGATRLEEDHVRHVGERLKGRLGCAEVVQGAITVGDVKVSEAPNVVRLFEVEDGDSSFGMEPAHFGDVVGTTVRSEHLASLFLEESRVQSDACTDLQDVFSGEGKSEAREVLLASGVDGHGFGCEEDLKGVEPHGDALANIPDAHLHGPDVTGLTPSDGGRADSVTVACSLRRRESWLVRGVAGPRAVPSHFVRRTSPSREEDQEAAHRGSPRSAAATVSIFTTAKPFKGHASIIQSNALRSWSLLSPRPDIILVGDEDGYGDATLQVGAVQVESLERNEFGTPLVSDVFNKGREHGSGEVLVFVNADIILPPRFAEAVAIVARRFSSFLLVGRRIDLDVTEEMEFGPDWYERLSARALATGTERGDLCIDYFVFNRDLFASIPPFAIGRTRYDNWLIWKAAEEGAPVIDCSPFVRVIHQNHDYGHLGGSIKAWEGAEARRAEQLLGHWSHYHSISHARYELSRSGEVVESKGWRYVSARPRRVASHLLRFSRPLRRRAKVLLATTREPRNQPEEPVGRDVNLYTPAVRNGTGAHATFQDTPVEAVREYWDRRPCNIRHSPLPLGTQEYFDQVEERKYFVEPHIPAFADFGLWRGKRVLEIGCGIGTDTINFARAGADVVACDLSGESVKLARERAEIFGVADRITFVNTDAETMAGVPDEPKFDLVYSFGVVHHTPHPGLVLEQARRRQAPGGQLKIMVYNRHSWKVAGIILGYGKGQFWKADRLIAGHSEAQTGCPVTFSYTKRNVHDLVVPAGYRVDAAFVDHIFPYRVRDYVEYRYVKQFPFNVLPAPLMHVLESQLGWHLMVNATAV